MKQVFIALGTNIEPREEHLNEALIALSKHGQIEIEKQSSIYETAPVGYIEQSDFLNMVIEVKTSFCPITLLDTCQAIEQQLGRKRGIRFGPRTIDLDILVYNQESIETERLTIPHPRMHERAFVLIPVNEIAPELFISTSESTVASLVKDLPIKDIEDVRVWS